jgi:mitochondrial chaperone BCS1
VPLSCPPRTPHLQEDVDSLFNEDRKNEDGSLTFSGMLNCLDGFLSADGVITIMTTNHADKLDAALTRGGRVDRRFAFDKPIQAQISALFLTFYPDADRALADEFSRVVFARPEGDSARSIATLQQLFIAQRRASAEECVAAIPAFFEMHFPNGAGSKHTLYT